LIRFAESLLREHRAEARCDLVGFEKVDPYLNPLRDDPRFQEVLKKAGFPE
jgi:hypothetical protein